MKKLILVVIALLVPFSVQAQKSSPNKSKTMKTAKTTDPTTKTAYIPVHEYDPKRDAEKDLQVTIEEAKRTNKRILLEVGGQWCVWCRIMDEYFAQHKELLDYREKHFIMVKINFSEENKNEAFLSSYPKIDGYPHIFVLDKDGKLLHSQNTGDLEEGKSYNYDKVFNFLRVWALPSETPVTGEKN
jgi:thioredoxin-related protein